MKCDQFREALRALHAWDRPDEELPAALRQHASGCVTCGDEWDRVRRLDVALSALARESSPGAPPALESRLLETFRAHHGHVVSASPQPQRTWTWLPLAAGIALAVAAGWWFVMRPVAPPDRQAHVRSQPAQPVLSAAATAGPLPAAASRSASNPDRPRVIDEQRVARVTKSAPAARTPPAGTLDRDPDAVMADFVTLPYGAMPTDDDVHLVQIDVPRDSLYDFGSTAQPGATANDMVTADVLIGDDGAPRAFRIVEPTATAVALDRQQSPFGARSPTP